MPLRKRAERVAANDAFAQVLDVNERILKEIHTLYLLEADGTVEAIPRAFEPKLAPATLAPAAEGIMSICSKLGISCIPPRRKINVMIIGNHSAGKSSYINWYVGEHVQTTNVAIETQATAADARAQPPRHAVGFTFCTSGKKRETLKGQATMQLFQHLHHDLQAFAPSIYKGLMTEVSTSKEKCFNLVTFIDTPGLVDGSFQYPFPVEDVIVSIAKHTDLIYIFFDPHGQERCGGRTLTSTRAALCERTLKVIERLNVDHAEKMRYFLSKVVVQITQNLSSRISNKHAFELPSLYIPDKAGAAACKIDNILEGTCDEMEHTINQNVQNNLDKLEVDCKTILTLIDEMLLVDAEKRRRNRKRAFYGYLLFFSSLLPLLVVTMDLVAQLCDAIVVRDNTQSGAQSDGAPPAVGLVSARQLIRGAAFAFGLLQVVSMLFRMYKPVLSKREHSNLQQTRAHVAGHLLDKKTKLYKLYLDQCNSDETAWTTTKPSTKGE